MTPRPPVQQCRGDGALGRQQSFDTTHEDQRRDYADRHARPPSQTTIAAPESASTVVKFCNGRRARLPGRNIAITLGEAGCRDRAGDQSQQLWTPDANTPRSPAAFAGRLPTGQEDLRPRIGPMAHLKRPPNKPAASLPTPQVRTTCLRVAPNQTQDAQLLSSLSDIHQEGIQDDEE